MRRAMVATEVELAGCGSPMQCNVTPELMELQSWFSTILGNMYCDPRTAELLNTTVGQYLTNHPFFALAVLVFGATAAVPVGLFLAFSVVTFIAVTVGFIFMEVFLLALGGVTLLLLLCGIAAVALLVSSVLGAFYITTSNLLNFYYSQRLPGKMDSTGDPGSKKPKGH